MSANLIIAVRACMKMQRCFTTADKHKMERFLRPDAPTVVSVYAPITFSPAGVLLFKQRSDGRITAPRPAGLIKDFCSCVVSEPLLGLLHLFRHPGPRGYRDSAQL